MKRETTNYAKHTSSDPARKFLIRRFHRTLIKTLKPLRVESILDAGCGEGFTLNELAKNNIGKTLEGMDFSKDALNLGKKQFPHFTFTWGSIYDMPYKSNSFDLVVSTEVLEHVEEPKKALEELTRVSRKYLMLSVPHEPFFMLSRLLKGLNIKQFGNHPEHIHHWSAISFLRFLKKENLKVKTFKLPFPWILILAEKR